MKCRKCHLLECDIGSRICHSCLKKYQNMTFSLFDLCVELYGQLSPDNHKFYINVRKKGEKVWRKNPEDLEKFIKNMKNNKII